jgi:hypothetical protein
MPLLSDLEPSIAELEAGAAKQDQPAIQEACFRLLYRLSPPTQIEGSVCMAVRYAPVFAHHWRHVNWPNDLLADLPDWVRRFGRRTPDAPDAIGPGDANFLFALDGLLMAGTVGDRHDLATMACAFAVVHAVEARAANVWAADDPGAVVLWRALHPTSEDETRITPEELADFHRRSVIENCAARAVRLREWRVFAAWLRALPASAMASSSDQRSEDRSFAAWCANEGLLPSVRSG